MPVRLEDDELASSTDVNTVLLIVCLLAAVANDSSSSDVQARTAAACVVGSRWTSLFIRYECFIGKALKGVRPIGCVPANGTAMLKAGETHDDKFFTYECHTNGSFFIYSIKNCLDGAGSALSPGANRTLPDGRSYGCFAEPDGSVRLQMHRETIVRQNVTGVVRQNVTGVIIHDDSLKTHN